MFRHASLERPRYIILAFQTGRKDKAKSDIALFDNCNLRSLRVWLNSTCFPYDCLRCDFGKDDYTEAYQAYSDFQTSFYNRKTTSEPISNYSAFKNKTLFIIDCSKQEEAVKSSTVDVQVEFESDIIFPPATRAYCLIVHDRIVNYHSLSGLVSEVK